MESYTTAKDLLNFAKEEKKLLKITDSDTPIPGYILHDIKIALRMKEDDIFLKNNKIYKNIRRGNCITEINGNTYKIGRKGIIKFFDYPSEFTSHNIVEKILEPVEKKFKKNGKVRVYITEKANGENCQISYERSVDGWIVGSKNVSILVRSKIDFDFYKNLEMQDRYSYALEFADLWFDIVEGIKSKGLYDQFVSEIDGFTLCGENVGFAHQHIKLYNSNNIEFFGMVNNNSNDLCLPINQVSDILNKYGLCVVPYEVSDIISDINEFKTYMKKVYMNVLLADVESKGEGCVAYIAGIDDEEEKIISIGKLKTFEYRFLRKIREKLKNNKKVNRHYSLVMKEVKKECDQILKEDGDDIDLSEFLRFGEFVLKMGLSVKSDKLQDNYASFIKMCKEFYQKTNQNFNEIKEEDLLEVQKIIGGGINEHWKQMKTNKDNNLMEVDSDSVQVKEVSEFDPFQKIRFKKGQTYIILIIGSVASGKSTIYQIMSETIKANFSDKAVLHYISSDKIKQEKIEEYLIKNPTSTHTEAHDKMNKYATSVFNKNLKLLIGKARDYNKVNFVFVDKNFPIESAQKLMNEYKSNQFLIFFPNISPDNDLNLPFSYHYMIQCYHRLKNRKNHETLDFEKNEYAHYILFSFICLYKDASFEFCQKNLQAVPLSITDETKGHISDPEFRSKFKQMINVVSKNVFEIDNLKQHDELIASVISLIESNYPETHFSDTRDLLRDEIKQILNNLTNI